MVYLTLQYPENYYFYKYEMFKDFIELIQFPYNVKKGSNENISQFIYLCDIINEKIIDDNELLKKHKNRINDTEYFDKSFKILTQDFIYACTNHLQFKLNQKTNKIKKLNELVLKYIIINPDNEQIFFKGSFCNHINEEKENKKIGDLGELLVLEYEEKKIEDTNSNNISVFHDSKLKGDGLGYDISIRDKNKNIIKYIEVKTTRYSQNTPFYITKTELERSKKEGSNYYLYRLYNFNDKLMTADYFIINGRLEKYCINPIRYKVILK